MTVLESSQIKKGGDWGGGQYKNFPGERFAQIESFKSRFLITVRKSPKIIQFLFLKDRRFRQIIPRKCLCWPHILIFGSEILREFFNSFINRKKNAITKIFKSLRKILTINWQSKLMFKGKTCQKQIYWLGLRCLLNNVA